MTDDKRVLIPTIDPRQGGGVLSVTKFTYQTARATGYHPRVVYNAAPWADCVTIRDMLKGQIQPRYEQTEIEGMKGTVIGRILPEIESLNYLANYSKWNNTIGKGLHFGVGGVCLPCLPLAIANENYSCWIGTLLKDERNVQLPDFGFIRRSRYQVERPLLDRLEGKTLRQADRLFVQSTYTKQRIHQEYGIPKGAIDHLPFPIDTEHFVPDANTGEGTEIIFVGRFNDPRKNIKLLLRAFAVVHQSVPGVTLTVVGDDPDREVASLISTLGLDNAVRIPGAVTEVVSYLQQGDVFVLPSRQEGLGIVGLEAMSCGLPVVATACGGPEDYVRDGETGYLVPRDDQQALTDRLIELLRNPELRQRFGDNGRTLIEQRYAASNIQHRLKGILAELSEY